MINCKLLPETEYDKTSPASESVTVNSPGTTVPGFSSLTVTLESTLITGGSSIISRMLTVKELVAVAGLVSAHLENTMKNYPTLKKDIIYAIHVAV